MLLGPTPMCFHVFGWSVMMVGSCDRRVTSDALEVEGSRARFPTVFSSCVPPPKVSRTYHQLCMLQPFMGSLAPHAITLIIAAEYVFQVSDLEEMLWSLQDFGVH